MYEEKTQRLLQRLQEISERLKGREFNFYPTNAINKGIVSTPQEYDTCINNLIQSGELVKTRTVGNTNYYQIPNYRIPKTATVHQTPNTSFNSPQTPRAITTLITPYDLRYYLDTKTTMVNDQVVPFSTLWNIKDEDIANVQEYFADNSLEVPNTCFQDFINTNLPVTEKAERLYGVEVVNAYLAMWWQYARKGTF